MKGLEVSPYELEYITSDGSKLIVEVNTKPIYKDGKIIGLQGISRNITERKKAEEKLRESEMQLRNVLNSLGDAIHVVDKELQFVMMNNRFIQWNKELGLETDFIGKSLFEVFSFLTEKIKDEYQQVFQRGKVIKTEEITRLGIQDLITETIKIPIMESGEVTQVITVIRDITKRKQVELKLLESEKRYRTLFESSPDSLTLLDPSGTITDCNEATEKLIGYSKSEIIGRKFQELLTIDPKDLPELIEKHSALMQGKELKPYELEIIRKDDIRRWLHIVSSILYSNDKITGFQVISRDITELKSNKS
jgi:PAS domain S-box-containing protein